MTSKFSKRHLANIKRLRNMYADKHEIEEYMLKTGIDKFNLSRLLGYSKWRVHQVLKTMDVPSETFMGVFRKYKEKNTNVKFIKKRLHHDRPRKK